MSADIALLLLPNTLVDGLILGFVYAVIALGYTMVYGVLELINFAHSEIFMVGGIVGVSVLLAIGGTTSPFLLIPLGLLIGAAAAGLLAVLIERVAYRPLRLRNAPRLVPLISAIGISFLLQDLMRLILSFSGNFYVAAPDYPQINQSISIGNFSIQIKSIIVIAIAGLMMIALNYLVNKSKLGKAIRAVAQDRSTAGLMGIDVNRVITFTFLIGGALGGIAGVLYGLQYNQLSPYVGFLPGLKAFTAAVLGGIGNIPGAMLGGIVLGLIETIAGTYVSTEYKDIIAFAALILILIFKPAGLLGKAVTEKV